MDVREKISYNLFAGLLNRYSDIIILDVETTGLDYHNSEIIDFGAIKLSNNKKSEFKNILIKPNQPLERDIIELTNITNENLYQNGIRKYEFANILHEFLSGDKILIIGYNLNFDMVFLREFMKHLGLVDLLKKVDYLDVYTVFRDVKTSFPQKLSDALIYYGINDIKNTHRAFDDAYATELVLENMLNTLDDVEEYINIFGYNPKFVNENNIDKLDNVVYIPQSYNSASKIYTSCKFDIDNGVLKKYNGNSKNIIIPDNVTCIDKFAFKKCSNLISITIPLSVNRIEDFAFLNCDQLEIIAIPKNVRHIGRGIVIGCTKLKNIDVDANNQYYTAKDGNLYDKSGRKLIQYAPGKKDTVVELHSYIETIGEYSFKGCYNIESIEIPTNVTKIERFAFSECRNLKNITFKKDSKLSEIGCYAFEYCNEIEEIMIPCSTLKIENTIFQGCNKIREITLPFIGDKIDSDKTFSYIFSGDYIEEYDYFKTKVPKSLKKVILTNISNICDKAFYECDSIEIIEIREKLISIGKQAFAKCSKLKSIDLDDSLEYIGSEAFRECKRLTEIIIPLSVSYMGDYVFSLCNEIDIKCETELIPSNWSATWNAGQNFTLGYNKVSQFQQENYEDFEIENKVLIKYIGNKGFVIIPKGIVRIKQNAFLDNNNLEEIIIGNDVEIIESKAFNKCWSLEKVVIYNNVKEIGKDAFIYCGNIKFIQVPFIGSTPDINDNTNFDYIFDKRDYSSREHYFEEIILTDLKQIKDNAFKDLKAGCKKLFIPNTVEIIGTSAFEYLKYTEIEFESNSKLHTIGEWSFAFCSLFNLNLPDNLTIIPPFAFQQSSISRIKIGRSVANIDISAFVGLEISYIDVDTENLFYKSIDGNLYDKNGKILFKYANGKTGNQFIIPKTVNTIGENAFNRCISLINIEIPNSVTSIGYGAFSGCSSLTSIEIPNSVTSIGYGAFSGCSSLTSIVIPNSITSIEEATFRFCLGLKSITIPDSVTSIGVDAFQDCNSLESIVIPKNVTRLSGFSGCKNLKNVVIPKGVISIGGFAGCKSLQSISIPDSVISLGGFTNCKSLQSIIIPDSVKSIGVFSGCESLQSIIIPNGVTIIPSNAFEGCTNLTTIEIPNSVTSIGVNAFRNCRNLISIKIPNSVKKIEEGSFFNCKSLSSMKIPNSVTCISNNAFNECISLNNIEFPDSITSIGYYAFSKCSNLINVVIPNSVKCIGYNAFSGCDKLTICCEVDSQPTEWDSSWDIKSQSLYGIGKPTKHTVIWGYKKNN